MKELTQSYTDILWRKITGVRHTTNPLKNNNKIIIKISNPHKYPQLFHQKILILEITKNKIFFITYIFQKIEQCYLFVILPPT